MESLEEKFYKIDKLFNPNSVAIIGVSLNPTSAGYHYTRHLLDYRFPGKIFPVNPNFNEIFGLKVYPRLKDVPEPSVDYVICCISAEKVLNLLEECHIKNVKLLHLFTARMKETGREDRIKLEEEILKKARSFGVRILGPNCMGLYNPKIGLSFNYDFPTEEGFVGGIFQSGGVSSEFIRYGALRGLRFTKVVSYGNALDIDESELLYYFAHDTKTKVVAFYVEGVKNGKKFVDALAYAAKRKPVVVLKGGRSKAGILSTLSHTASVAGSINIWRAVFKQYNIVEVQTLHELVDQIVAFSFLPPVTGEKVFIAGGGGGKSVLSADVWEEEGFKLPDLPLQVREKLKKIAPIVWDWLKNPIDVSILQDSPISPFELLRIAGGACEADLYVANLTEDDPLPSEVWDLWVEEHVRDIIKLKRDGKPVVAVVGVGEIDEDEIKRWKWRSIGKFRRKLVEEGIPVFPTPDRAAKALKRLVEYWKRKFGQTGYK
ncbi:MAG: CoA-binding protein [Candidatus Bathyarchaeota archaeon]|nr:CoA-binding protein [Candidatus Bathyarchaeota archaeon]